MKKVKLGPKGYRNELGGSVYETDDEKAEELVSLGYGKYAVETKVKKSPRTKVMRPRKKRVYKTK